MRNSACQCKDAQKTQNGDCNDDANNPDSYCKSLRPIESVNVFRQISVFWGIDHREREERNILISEALKN